MGVTITSLGDLGYDHEGYVANNLDTGEWTGTTSPDTRPRMTGNLRAQCSCGWHADRVWASDTPIGRSPSEDLEDQILTDWRDHVLALVDTTRTKDLAHVQRLLGQLGRSANRPITPEDLPGLDRVLDVTLRLVRKHRHSADTD